MKAFASSNIRHTHIHGMWQDSPVRRFLTTLAARFVRWLVTFVLKHYRLCDEHKAALLKVQFLCSASCVFGVRQTELSASLKRVLDKARRDMHAVPLQAEQEAAWELKR